MGHFTFCPRKKRPLLPLGDDVRRDTLIDDFAVADDEGVSGDGDFHRSGFGLPEKIGELAIAVLAQYFEALNFSKGTGEEGIEKGSDSFESFDRAVGRIDRTLFRVVLHDGVDISGADDFEAAADHCRGLLSIHDDLLSVRLKSIVGRTRRSAVPAVYRCGYDAR